eukprot:762950-Hanusia_phi.AAC.2
MPRWRRVWKTRHAPETCRRALAQETATLLAACRRKQGLDDSEGRGEVSTRPLAGSDKDAAMVGRKARDLISARLTP